LGSILLQISIVASIPFRFKAGGNGTSMPSSVSGHSHRSTTKASHKPFKSRKATKGAVKEIKKGIVVQILK
jgi:pre-rRNA-processing protein TSR1